MEDSAFDLERMVQKVIDRLQARRFTRTEAVRQLFIARGLPPDAVIAAGRGERELLVATADNVPEEKNRRVVITVR